MKKVLLLSPKFNNITDFFIKAIQDNNCQVFSLEFSPYGMDTALLKMLHYADEVAVEKKRKKFNSKALEKFHEVVPDVVIVIRGDYMQKEILQAMKSAKLILWMYDSIRRYPKMIENIELYDNVYTFDIEDNQALQMKHNNSSFLPLAYDEKTYFPKKLKKDVDISFVGALYPDRIELLEKVIADFPDLNIKVYGIYQFKRYIFSYIKFLMSGKKRWFKNKKLSHKKCNDLYNRSKICINILPEQYIEEWNARFFELNGSNSFQLVTKSKMTEKYYKDSVVTYSNYQDLKDKIQFYLSNDSARETIAEKAFNYSKIHDQYKNRFNKILKECK